MKQGEIWYVDLNPVKGSEQAGLRPVVVVSGNLANTYLNTLICCPLTSKVKNYKGNLVLEPNAQNGLTVKSEVLTFHIRSISKERLTQKVGTIDALELKQIKQCLDDIWRY
ncbi:MAG: type II toxin-antitoxin system PemK/MazF family toxin [Bacteroidia bacterium]|jgi:mRNA interferase MazF|nr:type II toxin-antitoxin system PemK/MazF family toxin [Bacteroidia bacterium]